MAVRFHLTAIRTDSAETVRAVFERILGPGFSEVELIANQGWISFSTSVWRVSRKDLLQGLEEIALPALQFTTEDGSRWYLTFFRPGKEAETILHEFGFHQGQVQEPEVEEYEEPPRDADMEFLEENPPPPPREKAPFDPVERYHKEMGLTLPANLLEEVRPLSYIQAVERFRLHQQDRILAWLEEMKVDCDPEAVRRVLAWEGVTERESESDIGNLPRLLSTLGLGGRWDEYVRQADNPPPEPEPELPPPPPQVVAAMEARLVGIRTTPVEGQPVSLPLKSLRRIGFLAGACQIENTPGALLTIELPPGVRVDVEPELPTYHGRAECRRTGTGFRIGIENYRLLDRNDLREQLGKRFAAFFRRLPDGTVLECGLAAENEPATHQVYRGVVRDRTWLIQASSPPVPSGVLQEAIDLARRSERNRHRLRDDEEVHAILRAAKKDPFLSGMGVKNKGLVVACDYDIGFLAALILRHRFRKWWDFGPVEAHAEKSYLEKIDQTRAFRKKAAMAARQHMAPRLGDPIFVGKAGKYWRSDLAHCGDLGEQLAAFEQTMRTLGFDWVGDFTSKKFRDYVLRCYVAPDQLSYADLTASRFGVLCWEFVTRFDDGSCHTTTTTPLAVTRPAVKLFYKDFPGLTPDKLHEKHLWCIDRFRTRKGVNPVPLEPTPAGTAAFLDDVILRTEEDEKNQGEDED